eukprot:scaffold664434_cov46-Prasinocladus_malaysianus.AAC.1
MPLMLFMFVIRSLLQAALQRYFVQDKKQSYARCSIFASLDERHRSKISVLCHSPDWGVPQGEEFSDRVGLLDVPHLKPELISQQKHRPGGLAGLPLARPLGRIDVVEFGPQDLFFFVRGGRHHVPRCAAGGRRDGAVAGREGACDEPEGGGPHGHQGRRA